MWSVVEFCSVVKLLIWSRIGHPGVNPDFSFSFFYFLSLSLSTSVSSSFPSLSYSPSHPTASLCLSPTSTHCLYQEKSQLARGSEVISLCFQGERFNTHTHTHKSTLRTPSFLLHQHVSTKQCFTVTRIPFEIIKIFALIVHF